MEIQWSLVVFSLLAGCGGATLFFVGLSELIGKVKEARFIAGILSIILLVIGGLVAVTHLGNPGNAMSAISNIFSFSGISLELAFFGLTMFTAVAYSIVRKREAAIAARGIGIIAGVFGLLLCVTLGISYMLGARPAWNNIGLPLSYLGSSLVMGGFLFAVIARLNNVHNSDLKMADVWTMVSVAIALIGYLAFGMFSGAAIDAAQAPLFWGAAVIVGGIVPGACAALLHSKGKAAIAYLGLATAVVGGFSLRVVMWAVGLPVMDIFGYADIAKPF